MSAGLGIGLGSHDPLVSLQGRSPTSRPEEIVAPPFLANLSPLETPQPSHLLQDLRDKVSDLHKLFFPSPSPSPSPSTENHKSNLESSRDGESSGTAFSHIGKMVKNMIQKGELTTEVAAELLGNLISHTLTTGGAAALGVLTGLSLNPSDASIPKTVNPQPEPAPLVQLHKPLGLNSTSLNLKPFTSQAPSITPNNKN